MAQPIFRLTVHRLTVAHRVPALADRGTDPQSLLIRELQFALTSQFDFASRPESDHDSVLRMRFIVCAEIEMSDFVEGGRAERLESVDAYTLNKFGHSRVDHVDTLDSDRLSESNQFGACVKGDLWQNPEPEFVRTARRIARLWPRCALGPVHSQIHSGEGLGDVLLHLVDGAFRKGCLIEDPDSDGQALSCRQTTTTKDQNRNLCQIHLARFRGAQGAARASVRFPPRCFEAMRRA